MTDVLLNLNFIAHAHFNIFQVVLIHMLPCYMIKWCKFVKRKLFFNLT